MISNSTKDASRKKRGRTAERAVERWLRDRGYEIVGRNLRFGHDEIDLLVRRGETLIVCEVRSRKKGAIDPSWAFDWKKRQRLKRAAFSCWVALGCPPLFQIDAAAVSFERDGSIKIEYYENAVQECA
ncbi:MAG: YraN family protein [Deltaproteobacteria bacterium]|nr:YraN family protein [Deltaproteobacteria bacterium]